jgi:hypothetical protein
MRPERQEEPSWRTSRIEIAYRFAKVVGFEIVNSFNMSWTECKDGGYWSTAYMANMLEKHASSGAS